MIVKNQGFSAENHSNSNHPNDLINFTADNQKLKGEKNSYLDLPPSARKHVKGDIYGAIQKAAQDVPLGCKDLLPHISPQNRNTYLNSLGNSAIASLARSPDKWLNERSDKQDVCGMVVWDHALFTKVKTDKGYRIFWEGRIYCKNRHTCPRCYNHMANNQAQMTVDAFEKWVSMGNDVLCVTYTTRHNHTSDSKEWDKICQLQMDAYAYFSKQGSNKRNGVSKLKKKWGWFSQIKRTEITFSLLGPHPHHHEGVFTLVAWPRFDDVDQFYESQKRAWFNLSMSEELWVEWDKLVRKLLEKNKGNGKYQEFDLRKFRYGDFIKRPFVEANFKTSIGNLKFNITSAIDWNDWDKNDWKKYIKEWGLLDDNDLKDTDEYEIRNMEFYVKGGVTVEIPRNSEAFAKYLSKELNSSAVKKAKDVVGLKHYSYFQLLQKAEEISMKNKKVGFDRHKNWADFLIWYYAKYTKGKRLFEFGRSDYGNGYKESFYAFLFPDKDEKIMENKEPNISELPTYFAEREDINRCKYIDNTYVPRVVDEFENENKCMNKENPDIFKNMDHPDARDCFGYGYIGDGINEEGFKKYRDKQMDNLLLNTLVSHYMRGNKNSELMKNRMEEVKERVRNIALVFTQFELENRFINLKNYDRENGIKSKYLEEPKYSHDVILDRYTLEGDELEREKRRMRGKLKFKDIKEIVKYIFDKRVGEHRIYYKSGEVIAV